MCALEAAAATWQGVLRIMGRVLHVLPFTWRIVGLAVLAVPVPLPRCDTTAHNSLCAGSSGIVFLKIAMFTNLPVIFSCIKLSSSYYVFRALRHQSNINIYLRENPRTLHLLLCADFFLAAFVRIIALC